MLKKYFKKEIISWPDEYGTITKRVEISPATDETPAQYVEEKERVLFRQAATEQRGGFIRKVAEYETRSERLIVPERTVTNPQTGKSVVLPATFKTVTRRVIKGYKSEFAPFSDLLSWTKNKQLTPTYTLKSFSIFTLKFFLPKEIREEVIGDILEDYEIQKVELKKVAGLWLVKEVIFTLANVFIDWFVKKIPISLNLRN